MSSSKLRWGPVHTNRNLICAIDIRTGGLDVSSSDLLEVCIVPVNHSFRVHSEFKLFNIRIRPSWPVDLKRAKLNRTDLEEYQIQQFDAVSSFSLFEHWFNDIIKFDKHKKIFPLCWDWSRIRPWLEMWMGQENFQHYIGESVRDLLPILNYMNDRQAMWGNEVTFKHPTFGQLLARQQIQLLDRNNLGANCKALIESYHAITKMFLSGYRSRQSENERTQEEPEIQSDPHIESQELSSTTAES